MRNRLRWVLWLTVAYGCSAPSERVQPVVEERAGIEVAVLPALPDFLDPHFQWTFRPIREITTVREGERDPIVYDPAAVLELSSGRLLVHDPTADLVFALLDSSGTSVVRRFGRKGQGPGELGRWISFRESQGTVSVLDPVNRQLHRFMLDGEAIGSNSISLSGYGGKAMAAPDGGFFTGRLHVTESEWYRELVRVDEGGGVASVVRLPDPSEFAEPGQIQRGRVVWTVVGTCVVAMWSDRPQAFVYDVDGSVVREIELPWTQRELTERDIAEMVEYHGGIASLMKPGPSAFTNELYPVGDSIFGMFTSQVWKAQSDPALSFDRNWWRLFTVRGEYVGVVELQEDFWPLGPSPRGVWARILNSRGEPVIQELELVRADSDENPST